MESNHKTGYQRAWYLRVEFSLNTISPLEAEAQRLGRIGNVSAVHAHLQRLRALLQRPFGQVRAQQQHIGRKVLHNCVSLGRTSCLLCRQLTHPRMTQKSYEDDCLYFVRSLHQIVIIIQ